MGFYFRKTIKFGGLRFNISKSGIGVSTGVKGFRIGTGPRGNYVHIGTHGLYYRASLGSRKKRQGNISHVTPDNLRTNGTDLDFVNIESSDVTFIKDSSSAELLEEINKKLKKVSFWPFSVIFLLINLFAGLAAAIILYLIDRKRKTTVLLYNIDEIMEAKLQSFYDAFDELKSCRAKWHLQAEAVTKDYKHFAGANRIIRRKPVNISDNCPKYMKTNVKVPCIPVGKQKLYFFPDRIFIYHGNKAGSLSYSNLKIQQQNARFIEKGSVPKDGTIVDYTWEYINKQGGPDKRFSNNRQLPVLLYSELRFSSDNGLNECIQLSRQNAGLRLIKELSNLSNSIYSREATGINNNGL